MADRFGRKTVLVVAELVAVIGLLITLPANLPAVLGGVLLFTAGFFAAHSVASGWVGATADAHRAEASALYLFAYYLGSSVLGALAGLWFAADGWAGVVVYVGVLFALALALAVIIPLLRRRCAATRASGVS